MQTPGCFLFSQSNGWQSKTLDTACYWHRLGMRNPTKQIWILLAVWQNTQGNDNKPTKFPEFFHHYFLEAWRCCFSVQSLAKCNAEFSIMNVCETFNASARDTVGASALAKSLEQRSGLAPKTWEVGRPTKAILSLTVFSSS